MGMVKNIWLLILFYLCYWCFWLIKLVRFWILFFEKFGKKVVLKRICGKKFDKFLILCLFC